MPLYGSNNLDELQDKFDELEALGIFKRPENIDINVEYVNPSLLVRKARGGFRLVTAFSDVGRYTKPQLSLMPNVDNILRMIYQWKYLIQSDLPEAFYQISLEKESMKYCGVVTPNKGAREYVRSAMGMPGSETALEEVMCRVLGDFAHKGVVAKIADNLFVRGNTIDKLYINCEKLLLALQENNLRLSAAQTIICPKSTTVLGWVWSQSSLSASKHRI